MRHSLAQSFVSMPCMHRERPACRQASPTGAMGFDEERRVADKCTYCAHRLARNEQPACVSKCPGHALSFGTAEALGAQARSQGRGVLNIDAGTRPSTFYLARTKA